MKDKFCERIERREVKCPETAGKEIKCFRDEKVKRPCTKRRCLMGELVRPTKDGRTVCRDDMREG